MIDRLRKNAWGIGLQLRNSAKRAALLGPLEKAALWLAPRVISPPKTDAVVDVPGGAKLTVPAGLPASWSYRSGMYEPEVTQLFAHLLRAGMTVIDVGANIGYYTVICASLVGKGGRVYSFEPDPWMFGHLRSNVLATGLNNVRLHQEAVADQTTHASFVRDRFGTEGHLAAPTGEAGEIVVATRSIDSVIAQDEWPIVDIIKVDAEGAELAVLNGMGGVSRRNADLKLIMELNAPALSRQGVELRQIASKLCDLGFTRGSLIEHSSNEFQLPDGLPATKATYNLLLLKQPHWSPV